jgi:putative ABC transport system substrate-binding protein
LRRASANGCPRWPGSSFQLRVDVIVAIGGTSGAAADATKTIPIVLMGADPLASGVASLTRPGGNVTGVVISEGGLGDKRLQLLREAIPRTTRIAVLATTEPAMKGQWQEVKKAADVLRLAPILVEVPDSDYDRAFTRMVSERAAGILVLASAVLHRDRKTIIALAAKHRLPAIYQWREHAEDGGLMSYRSSLVSLTRRVAVYVDRLFKGAKPTDLPVEQPTTYELVINRKTAKALGLTIPQSLLGRADELIQ